MIKERVRHKGINLTTVISKVFPTHQSWHGVKVGPEPQNPERWDLWSRKRYLLKV